MVRSLVAPPFLRRLPSPACALSLAWPLLCLIRLFPFGAGPSMASPFVSDAGADVFVPPGSVWCSVFRVVVHTNSIAEHAAKRVQKRSEHMESAAAAATAAGAAAAPRGHWFCTACKAPNDAPVSFLNHATGKAHKRTAELLVDAGKGAEVAAMAPRLREALARLYEADKNTARYQHLPGEAEKAGGGAGGCRGSSSSSSVSDGDGDGGGGDDHWGAGGTVSIGGGVSDSGGRHGRNPQQSCSGVDGGHGGITRGTRARVSCDNNAGPSADRRAADNTGGADAASDARGPRAPPLACGKSWLRVPRGAVARLKCLRCNSNLMIAGEFRAHMC